MLEHAPELLPQQISLAPALPGRCVAMGLVVGGGPTPGLRRAGAPRLRSAAGPDLRIDAAAVAAAGDDQGLLDPAVLHRTPGPVNLGLAPVTATRVVLRVLAVMRRSR